MENEGVIDVKGNPYTEFENQINERRNSLATVAEFQKRWTINSIKNLIQVLNSPNILLEKQAASQISQPSWLPLARPWKKKLLT